MWVTSVLLPIGVSAATVAAIGLTVGPRLAARGKRIQAAYDSRDRFGDSVLDILALCKNLETVPLSSEITDPFRSRLQGERDRWLSQVDEITTWLVDHWQRVALGYARPMGIRNLVVRYVAAGRGLWLSDRPLEERVRLLRELTEHVQIIYFARRLRIEPGSCFSGWDKSGSTTVTISVRCWAPPCSVTAIQSRNYFHGTCSLRFGELLTSIKLMVRAATTIYPPHWTSCWRPTLGQKVQPKLPQTDNGAT
jgi:hypothetical protein